MSVEEMNWDENRWDEGGLEETEKYRSNVKGAVASVTIQVYSS